MRLLLLSNSRNPGGRFLAHAVAEMRDFLGAQSRRLLFFPFASVRTPHDAAAARVRKVFAKLGHEMVSAHRVAPGAALARAIDRADGFVTGGGNTFRLLDEMQRRGALGAVAKRVRAGVPYIGWSAGANLACPTIRTTNDMPIVEPASLDAMGLVHFQLNPHYTERVLPRHGGEPRDLRIAEFLALNPQRAVLGVREGSLLRVEGARAELSLGPGARLFRSGARPRDYRAGADLSFLVRGLP